MAFVNRQGGEQRRNEMAESGQTVDFDPNDPTVVKVHYDLGLWTWEQRAELSEALADGEIPHVWDAEELVVPELVEERVDAVFDRLEGEIGPFPVPLDPDAESTEFGLDEWTEGDRAVLTDALVDAEVPFRWEGTTVIVARDAEDAVDDLLDAIEAGELLTADESPAAEPPDGALSSIFLSADRLARDSLHAGSRASLLDLDDKIDGRHPPYAFSPRTWVLVTQRVGTIAERIREDAAGGSSGDEEQLSEMAAQLRELVRPFV